MSCQKCDEFQNSHMSAYYRWKNANIEIRACKEHTLEIFKALEEYTKNHQRENL